MTARTTYPAGVPCWVHAPAADPAPRASFYAGLLDWEVATAGAVPGGTHVARLDDLDVAGLGGPTDDAGGWVTSIAVASADEAARAVRAAGGEVLEPPADVAGAGRGAACADPAGATFRLWEARGHHGAQRVNAPGTWNWSTLSTPDPEAAGAFYGAVFGWVAHGAGGGPALLALPGYAALLERDDPGLRRRHAEAGVPESFSDAVAWVGPAEAGAPARWEVTFSVEDVDAVAARAAALGGSVAVAPFDVAPVRMAVLADPAGAAFTVSRYDGPSG